MSDSATSGPLLSVIIVNWNGAAFLPRCLQSLREQSLSSADFQTIVVDNASTDASLHLIRDSFAEVAILALDANFGYAEANNRAARTSRARYLLFLNNDTYLDSEALETLAAAAEQRPSVAIFAPQLRTYDGKERLTMGIGLDVFGFPCGTRTFYADGAALFMRADVFARLGGFDPAHFMFFEETDLCWRAWLQGYRIGTVPEAIVFHKAGGTAGSSTAEGGHYSTSRNKRRLSHRNQLATLLKNYSMPVLCVVLPLFAALTAAEVAVLFRSGQRSAIRDIYLPAWSDLLRNRAHLRAMRRRIQSSRTVSDWTILRRLEWRSAMVDQFRRTGAPTLTR